MRVARSLVAIAMAGVFGVPMAMAQTINVPADQPTIQAAVAVAVNGDVISVAPGTYNGPVVIVDKAISLVSVSTNPSDTVIQGGGRPLAFSGGPVTIRGFTITGGTDGGLSAGSATGLVERNVIIDNSACGSGNGVALNFSSVVFRHNVVAGNQPGGCSGGFGGGVSIGGASTPGSSVQANLIVNNRASSGAGVAAFASAPEISGNIIADNIGGSAGALWMVNTPSSPAPLVANNLIVRNSAGTFGGIDISPPSGSANINIIGNTLAENTTQSGAQNRLSTFGNTLALADNVITGSGGPLVSCSTESITTVESNDVFRTDGGLTGAPCAGVAPLAVSPSFVAADLGDFHLTTASALIDAGVAAPLITADNDGDVRPLDGGLGPAGAQPDIGFDEAAEASNLVETTITSSPPPAVGLLNLTPFTFVSPTVGATFECDFDMAGFAPCTSPAAFPNTGSYTHSFRVRAKTAGGQVDRSPAMRLVTIDGPPQTIIDSGPFKNGPSWRATFHSDDPAATFECAIDTGAFSPCGTPFDFAAPSVGPHTLSVRAKDVLGLVDPTPASAPFNVPPPDTFLAQATPVFNSNKWSITITSDVDDATFECSLDGGHFTACSNPVEVTAVPGTHTMSARATSGGVTDASPGSTSWTSSCTLFGSFGFDTLLGTTGSDGLCGLAGDDVLRGLAGDDFLSGGTGDDVLNGGPGADSLNGNDGIDDVADYSDRVTPVKVVLGDGLPDGGAEDGAGDTIGVLVEDIWGGSGNDQLTGDFDDNVIDGGLGADIIQGGAGFDFADYSMATTPVTADLDGQVGDDGRAGEGDSIGIDVESVLGGFAGDSLTGGFRDDFIAGGAGNDTLTGGAGSDSIFGEDGNDTIVAADGVIDDVDCGLGIDTAYIDVGESVFNCEATIFGSPPPPPPPPPVAPIHRLRLTGGSGTSTAGLLVKLTCDSNQVALCTVRLVAKTTVVVKGKKRTYTLGQLSAKLTPGLASSLPIRLNARAATLFKTRTKLTVRVESTLTAPSGVATAGPKRTVVVRRSKTALKTRVLLARRLHALAR